MYLVWSSIEARAATPVGERPLVSLYVDELATLTGSLPFSFELLAERARGFNAAITVSLQTLGRVPEPTRSSLLANCATLVVHRTPAGESQRLAAELPPLSARDLVALGRFEVGARVGTGVGSAVAVVTGHTQPLPPATGQADIIRERSATSYGTPAQPERADTTPTDASSEGADLGRQRRHP